MGKRAAALVGMTEWAPQRTWPEPMFGMEACAVLAAEALADAGIEKDAVDGLVCGGLSDSPMFSPLALAEYLGIRSHFNETVDIGGFLLDIVDDEPTVKSVNLPPKDPRF